MIKKYENLEYLAINNTVVLNKYNYEIDMDRCLTHKQLIGWIKHLCEKDWITQDTIYDLIEVYEDLNAENFS